MSKDNKVLIFAPHPDDETLGVGGTINKMSQLGYDVYVVIVSGHLPPLYDQQVFNKTKEEAKKALDILGVKKAFFLELPATRLADIPVSEMNAGLFKFILDIKPEIVFTPYPDRHIDHRIIFESVMVITRPVGPGRNINILAAYETLSETHWNAPHIEPNFIPNWTIDISENMSYKIDAMNCYESQISKTNGPRSIEAIEALAKFRGTQSGFIYGESFHIIRMNNWF